MAEPNLPTEKEVYCYSCGCPLELKAVSFSYLSHKFHTDLPTCPKCGYVYIPESLVKGRMAAVEMELEDK